MCIASSLYSVVSKSIFIISYHTLHSVKMYTKFLSSLSVHSQVAADKAETSLRVAREELRLQEAAAVRADLELAAEEKLFAEESPARWGVVDRPLAGSSMKLLREVS